ncbi:hypothetical protein [Streptomyces sp. NPDC048606]|uniref:hypothetical protein n=1 Tax=Streptomyces sp. NPDC048606 TaxID=3154726 RepID=UPI00343A07CD
MTPAARTPFPHRHPRVRRWAATAAALPLGLALAACGTVVAGSGSGSGSVSPSAPVPDRPALEARARAAQIAVENVYVTGAPGFAPAVQSAGVSGDDGFSVTYVHTGTGARIDLTAERRPLDTVCGRGCVPDGGLWYRAGDAGEHAYAVERDGLLVRLAADPAKVDRATLREAAKAAHPASDAELDAVLPAPRGDAGPPPTRGDLPPVGDGAPNNEVGASG